jgi:hypothetical protein
MASGIVRADVMDAPISLVLGGKQLLTLEQ